MSYNIRRALRSSPAMHATELTLRLYLQSLHPHPPGPSCRSAARKRTGPGPMPSATNRRRRRGCLRRAAPPRVPDMPRAAQRAPNPPARPPRGGVRFSS
jgi:hypothetical protein